jgi:transcriptional regulator with XRE-family HTH domain
MKKKNTKPSNDAMLAREYRRLRQERGTQSEVAEALGVSCVTISCRENGHCPVGAEAFAALRSLAVKPKAK